MKIGLDALRRKLLMVQLLNGYLAMKLQVNTSSCRFVQLSLSLDMFITVILRLGPGAT